VVLKRRTGTCASALRAIVIVLAFTALLGSCGNSLLSAAKNVAAVAVSPKIAVTVGGKSLSSGQIYTFGQSVTSSTATTVTVKISNAGVNTLAIDSTKVALTMETGTAAGTFSLSADALPATLATGKSAEVSLSFCPATVGDKVATLTIPTNDVTTPSYSLTLTGTGVSLPNAPNNVSASSGNGKVSVSWGSVANAQTYNLYYSTTKGEGVSGTKLAGVSSPYTLSSLTNDTPYYFVVTTVNAAGESGASSEAQATPQAAAADAPADVSAAAGDSSVTVSWSSVSGAKSYNLYYQSSSKPVLGSSGIQITDVTSPYTVKGLTAGLTYYFVVTDFNSSGVESGASAYAAAIPLTTPAQPGSISAKATSYGNVRVTGAAALYATSYKLYISTSSAVSISDYVSTLTSSSYIFNLTASANSLASGTTYYFIMTALNGSLESAATDAVSVLTYPAPPASVSATAHSSTAMDLAWPAATGASSYNVYYGTSSSLSTSSYDSLLSGQGSSSSTGCTVTGLSASTSYNFLVTTVNGTGESPASTLVSGLTLPSAPTELAATATATDSVSLSWKAVTRASSYTLYYSTSSSVSTSTTTKLTGITSASASVSGLSSGTKYYFVVTATNASGESAASSSANALTYPAAPTGLVATASSTSAIGLSWTASTGAASYTVYYSTDSGVSTSSAAISGLTSASTTVSGLASGTKYYFIVTATNATGQSAVSSTANASSYCAAPASLTATASSTSAIALSWTASTGASSYTLYYSTSSSVSTSSTAISGLTGTSTTVSGLSADTTYYFIVTALNAAGVSAESNSPSALTYPATPTGFTASGASASSIALSWTASSGSATYKVYRSTSSGFTASSSTLLGSSSTASYSDTSPTALTTYYYLVVAVNATGSSASSSQASAMTLCAAPAPVQTSVMVDNGSVYLPWTAVTGATSYKVYRSTSSGSGFSAVASGVTNAYYFDSGLANWTTYYYKVAAVNSGGESAASIQVYGMPVHEAVYILDFNNANMMTTSVTTPATSATAAVAGTWTLGSLSSNLVGAGPSMAAEDASMKYVYESNLNTGSGGIAGYSISSSTGAITGLVEDKDISIAMEGIGIASPGGAAGKQYLYATAYGNSGSAGIYYYSINNSTGALTRLGTAVTDNNPRGLVVSPDGKYLFVTSMSSNTVRAYKISSDGSLALVIGRYTSTSPFKMAISPSGKNLYVANFAGGSVSQYSIDTSTGTLSDHAILGADISVGSNPTSVAIDPSGSFLYVANAVAGGSGTIDLCSVNPSTGALTKGSYAVCDAYCNQVAVDYSGQYLLAACSGSKTVELFSINKSTGALTYQNKWTITASNATPASVFIAKLP
jgi:6-phosphogluconolactonase (cycloisomerase 2 family)/fibronectin type 3 domain-containing protein